MSRAPLLALIDVARGRGLEIGAFHRPMITRDMGPVEYVDRASREDVLRTYADSEEVRAEDAVEVDHIWGERSLLDCVGGARVFDYVVSSHVIEHVPDLFGWLGEIAAVLVDGGVAGFVVPDKRRTFDLARRVSHGPELVDAYLRGLRRPGPQQVFDFCHHYRDPATGADRDGRLVDEASLTASARAALAICREMETDGRYIDAHCWTFTPRSLLGALDLCSRLGLLPFEIALLAPTPAGSHEFLLALRRLPEGSSLEAQREAFRASCASLDLPPEGESVGGDVDELRARVDAALERVAAIENSTSWRITAPLRAAVTVARRLTGRA